MPVVKKAVILAAGLGTRMLPATKAVPKEMLPIVDRPLIQYAVEEAVAAGIEEVIFVVAEGKEAIAAHFGNEGRVVAHLRQNGDAATLAAVNRPAELARYHYVIQDHAWGIAHAVACARAYVEGEPFALMFPDDLILGARPCLAQLADAHASTGGTVIAVQRVPRSEVHHYGIVDPADDGNPMALRRVVEKPSPEAAPSDLGIVGRYILGETIFSHIDQIAPGANGELQITDAIAGAIAAGEPVSGYRYEGRRYDTGRPAGYLAANLAAALERPDLRGAILERIRELSEGAAV